MKTVCLHLTIVLIAISFQVVNGLNEGDNCTNANGQTGICMLANKCKILRSLLDVGVRPMICGFPGTGRCPIICCPPKEVTTLTTTASTTTTSTTEQPKKFAALTAESKKSGGVSSEDLIRVKRIAQLKCEDYGELVIKEIPFNPGQIKTIDNCVVYKAPAIVNRQECEDYGVPVIEDTSNNSGQIIRCLVHETLAVVEGLPADKNEFPHMTRIGYLDPPEYLCGGSLISERFILSAAHCSRQMTMGPARWAKVGELDSTSDLDQAGPNVYRIIQILDHPEYDPITFYNDITLYKLERKLDLNRYIRPACLNYIDDLDVTHAVAIGYGHIEFGGKASSYLLKVTLDLVDNVICNLKYRQTIERGPKIPQGVRDGSMICAGSAVGMDTCTGDSGGPLQLKLDNPYCMYSIIGIISFGRGCAWGYPGIYTRVSHYLPWIVQNVWGDEL